MSWGDRHRLRKYERKVARAFARRKPALSWLLILKWRYWHRVYGGHVLLWKQEGSHA